MSRQQLKIPVSSPRLLASAIGVAITATSAAHMAQAAESTESKAQSNSISLGATTVTGEAQDQKSYQVEKASSQKYTAPLIDTPRSVTVIPQQVLQDTAATSLQDALRTVPGITFGAGEGGNPQGDRPFIRGFDAQSDMYLDGVRDAGGQTREIFDIESIEVSKGPNSSFGGRGSAGGSLNMVSKAPKMGDFLNGGFTYGSDQTRRYTVDVNRQFLDTAAFRLNLMSHEQNVSGRDAVNYDRWGVAPSLTFGLGTENRLNVSYYHLESNDLPDSGIPYGYSNSSRTAVHGHDKPDDGGNSSNFYGLKDRDFRKTRVDISTISFEHDFSDAMTLKNTFRHGNTGQDYILTQPDDSQHNVNQFGTVWRRANTRVSTTEGGVRAFADFDRFDVEDFAGLTASIAHAVQVHVGLCVQTTEKRTVALWVAAFACAESDAWHGAQGVLQRGGCGVLQHLLRDHGDRARRINQRCGVLLGAGFLGLIRLVSLLAGNRGRAKGNTAALGLAVSALGSLNQMACRGRGNRDTDGRSQ